MLDALFSAARSERPDTARAEHGFETRLLARLAAGRSAPGGAWEFAVWCWRLVPVFAVVTLAFTFWTLRPDEAGSEDGAFSAAVQPLTADDDLTDWLTVGWLEPI